jgi:hypothetical protein
MGALPEFWRAAARECVLGRDLIFGQGCKAPARLVDVMGLMRAAIVVGAVVALLPSDREQQQKLIARASDAATWVTTYCDRNAATCAQANEHWKTFVAKAEFGAKLVYEAMQNDGKSNLAERADRGAPKSAPAVLKHGAGTLTPNDLEPAWRGRDKTQRGSI